MIGPKAVLTSAAGRLAPKVIQSAPGVTTTVVRQALHHAIVGVRPAARERPEQPPRSTSRTIDNDVELAG